LSREREVRLTHTSIYHINTHTHTHTHTHTPPPSLLTLLADEEAARLSREREVSSSQIPHQHCISSQALHPLSAVRGFFRRRPRGPPPPHPLPPPSHLPHPVGPPTRSRSQHRGRTGRKQTISTGPLAPPRCPHDPDSGFRLQSLGFGFGYLEKGIQNSHGARLVHLIMTMTQWIRTSWLTIKNSHSLGFGVQGIMSRGRPSDHAPLPCRQSRKLGTPQFICKLVAFPGAFLHVNFR